MGSKRQSEDSGRVDPKNILPSHLGQECAGRLLRTRKPATVDKPREHDRLKNKSSDIHMSNQQARTPSPTPRTFSIPNILSRAKAKQPSSTRSKPKKVLARQRVREDSGDIGGLDEWKIRRVDESDVGQSSRPLRLGLVRKSIPDVPCLRPAMVEKCPPPAPLAVVESVDKTVNVTVDRSVGTTKDSGPSRQAATTPSSRDQTEAMEEEMTPGPTEMEQRMLDLEKRLDAKVDAKLESTVRDKRRAEETAAKTQRRLAKVHRRLALYRSRVPKSELAALEVEEAELLQETSEDQDATVAHILEETLEEAETLQSVQGSETNAPVPAPVPIPPEATGPTQRGSQLWQPHQMPVQGSEMNAPVPAPVPIPPESTGPTQRGSQLWQPHQMPVQGSEMNAPVPAPVPIPPESTGPTQRGSQLWQPHQMPVQGSEMNAPVPAPVPIPPESTGPTQRGSQLWQPHQMPVLRRMNPLNGHVIPSVSTNDWNLDSHLRDPQDLRRPPIHGIPETRPLATFTPVTAFPIDAHLSAPSLAGPSTFHPEDLSTGNGNYVAGILGPADSGLRNWD